MDLAKVHEFIDKMRCKLINDSLLFLVFIVSQLLYDKGFYPGHLILEKERFDNVNAVSKLLKRATCESCTDELSGKV